MADIVSDGVVHRLFERWGLEKVQERQGKNGPELWACCPFHGESTPSFSVNIENGQWHCLACKVGGKSVQKLVQDMEGGDGKAHVSELMREVMTTGTDEYKRDIMSALEDFTEAREPEKHIDMNVSHAWRDYVDNHHDYLLGRGFTEETIERFKIGYVPKDDYELKDRDCIFIPLFEYGICRMYSTRTVHKKKRGKYIHQEGIERIRYFWGLDEPRKNYEGKPIVLTEGQLDAMWLKQHGYNGALSVLGSKLSVEQVEKLKDIDPSEIVLFFDNDKAGVEATEQAGQLLLDSGFNRVYYLRYSKKDMGDPQDCPPDAIERMFGRKRHIREFLLRKTKTSERTQYMIQLAH